jgi:AraC-like DNA-binding protein
VDVVHSEGFGNSETDLVADEPTADVATMPDWTVTRTFEEFAQMCCGRSHLNLLTDPNSFSLTHRAARVGPVSVAEANIGSDTWVNCVELCSTYRVLVLQSGHTEWETGGLSASAGPGTAAVYAPEGIGAAGWAAGSKVISFKIARGAVEDALSDAIGHQLTTSHVDFTPIMPTTSEPTRTWIRMLSLFTEQLFQPRGRMRNQLVGLPFADSLVRAFLLAADYSHRDAVTRTRHPVPSRAIRTAVEIIEENAHLPLTVSSIAKRSHISVRALQQGFRDHLGASPMTYLREVRLRRAHQTLLASDPSTATVDDIARRWGFTNAGRFAAAHTARYGEPPRITLRRSRI